ncbi:thioesterase II family protein [Streptomyces hesseae]|uniref:Uncharacterized protein n=1 Tax=Streptomyces hesseae TaxID=3075519 RepID=A0ABU2SW36_9ACTN|nr:thioesterase domain-containing protein [Streptomyces sp. DSM 40473]MDT0453212.1 hypothetical protein [Streptomyces sp. DSM 40473]
MTPYPLILLHHAGGSAVFFAPLAKALPPEIQPMALDLPGRGRRWREAAVTSIDGPFAVLGHSLPFEGSPLGVSDEEIFEITNQSGGGVAQEVLDHPQLRRRTADLLRADFAVSRSFLSKQRRTVTEADIAAELDPADRVPRLPRRPLLPGAERS